MDAAAFLTLYMVLGGRFSTMTHVIMWVYTVGFGSPPAIQLICAEAPRFSRDGTWVEP